MCPPIIPGGSRHQRQFWFSALGKLPLCPKKEDDKSSHSKSFARLCQKCCQKWPRPFTSRDMSRRWFQVRNIFWVKMINPLSFQFLTRNLRRNISDPDMPRLLTTATDHRSWPHRKSFLESRVDIINESTKGIVHLESLRYLLRGLIWARPNLAMSYVTFGHCIWTHLRFQTVLNRSLCGLKVKTSGLQLLQLCQLCTKPWWLANTPGERPHSIEGSRFPSNPVDQVQWKNHVTSSHYTGQVTGVTGYQKLDHGPMEKWSNGSKPWKPNLMIPSGELTFGYGKSPFLMGKSTINGHFQLLC